MATTASEPIPFPPPEDLPMEIDQDPAGIYQGHIHQLDSSLLNEIADDETSCPDDDIVNEVVELLLEDDTKEGMEPELMEMNNTMMTEDELPARSSFRQVSDASSQPATATAVTPTPPTDEEFLKLTGRPAVPLYLSCNPGHLSAYQSEIRKNISFFEANAEHTSQNSKVKGRNKPITLGT